MTEFKEIARFPGYLFGSDGSIIGRNGKPLAQSISSGGYLAANLTDGNQISKRYLSHRLILEAFRGPPPHGYHGCHFPDPNKSNNHITNLMWGSKETNARQSIEQGLRPRGEEHGKSKLDDDKVRLIFSLHKRGLGHKRIGRLLGVWSTTIADVLHRKTWGHVSVE